MKHSLQTVEPAILIETLNSARTPRPINTELFQRYRQGSVEHLKARNEVFHSQTKNLLSSMTSPQNSIDFDARMTQTFDKPLANLLLPHLKPKMDESEIDPFASRTKSLLYRPILQR